MAKWMWIVAGPNGAGKSTFANEFLKTLGHNDLEKLNADERTARLRAAFPDAEQDDLNLLAAIEIDREVEACIAAGQSFVVETVLSSPKYRDDVLAAKAAGFTFGLIYISLFPPELSPLRVGERVAKRGPFRRCGKGRPALSSVARTAAVVRGPSGFAHGVRQQRRERYPDLAGEPYRWRAARPFPPRD